MVTAWRWYQLSKISLISVTALCVSKSQSLLQCRLGVRNEDWPLAGGGRGQPSRGTQEACHAPPGTL